MLVQFLKKKWNLQKQPSGIKHFNHVSKHGLTSAKLLGRKCYADFIWYGTDVIQEHRYLKITETAASSVTKANNIFGTNYQDVNKCYDAENQAQMHAPEPICWKEHDMPVHICLYMS
jgi:hypothetical protein